MSTMSLDIEKWRDWAIKAGMTGEAFDSLIAADPPPGAKTGDIRLDEHTTLRPATDRAINTILHPDSMNHPRDGSGVGPHMFKGPRSWSLARELSGDALHKEFATWMKWFFKLKRDVQRHELLHLHWRNVSLGRQVDDVKRQRDDHKRELGRLRKRCHDRRKELETQLSVMTAAYEELNQRRRNR